MKSLLYKLYRKMNNSYLISTFSFALYSIYIKYKNYILGTFRLTNEFLQEEKFNELGNVKIAFVSDEMTYTCFSKECSSIFLTPYNWKKTMDKFQPDLFFCESAWEGLKKYHGIWRGKIYRNHKVLFENRKHLLKILSYCKDKGIPTVFWNKEDPVFFDDANYDFVDTALKFDYIYTTCQECIPYYQAKGHSNVNTLMFGVTPQLYNPINSFPKEYKAVFAGSWYKDQKERCNDMEKLFDMVLQHKIPLEIYDRNYSTQNFNTKYPKKYTPYIKPSVSYSELNEIIKKAEYAITINTVKDSNSMFARRAFEIMMCNTTLISNHCKGLKKIFKSDIWFYDEKFECNKQEHSHQKNIEMILENHTNQRRLKEICTNVGITIKEKKNSIAIIYWNLKDKIHQKDTQVFKNKDYPIGYFYDGKICWEQNKEPNCAFYYCIKDLEHIDLELDAMRLHFQYLQNDVCIHHSKEAYHLEQTTEWTNILIKKSNVKNLILNNPITLYSIGLK